MSPPLAWKTCSVLGEGGHKTIESLESSFVIDYLESSHTWTISALLKQTSTFLLTC